MATLQAPVTPQVAGFLSKPRKMLINNQWVESVTGKTFPVYNPATGEEMAQVAQGEARDIELAVKAARNAFDKGPWRRMTAAHRARLMWKLADLLEANLEEFAMLESLDNGKPLTVARAADVPLAVELFRYMGGWTTKLEGNTIPLSVPYTPGAQYLAYTQREPVGVVGQIIPWNFPLLMAAWKLGPALACGCGVVLKPAEQTPLTALRLGELIVEAGFPPGVVNIVPGYGEAGAALVAHPDVDKVTFTGSPAVGRQILRSAAGNLKRVTLELGGKSANIIFADADLAAAADSAPMAVFGNAGQDCCARSRILVQRAVLDQFMALLEDAVEAIRVGDPMDPETQMGPLISAGQRDTVASFVGSDAPVAIQGSRPDGPGYWFAPTVLCPVAPDDRAVREEIFGPVACVIPFRDEDEAVRIANDTMYGLSGSIWTRDGARALRVARAVETGVISINSNSSVRVSTPFGGFKQYGYGRELGPHATDAYTETKTIYYATT